jgi:hypothetical protein
MTALQKAAAIEWDKDDIDALKFMKVDVTRRHCSHRGRPP